MLRVVTFVAISCVIAAATFVTDVSADTDFPVLAIHIEPHTPRDCDNLPTIEEETLKTTYDGVGRIDAFVVISRFGEAKGVSFGLTWPEAWGRGEWHDCAHLKIADISSPGDMTSLVWKDCQLDSVPLIVGWLTLTVTSPGMIEALPSPKEEAVAIASCNEIAPELSEAIICLKGGAGGIKGDDAALLREIKNRNWYIRSDSKGDAPSIHDALRRAYPGDTVFVATGTYSEDIILRSGVVVLGSWDHDFKTRDLGRTPSIINPGHDHSVVRSSFGDDSTTVLDGFVITGGGGTFGGGIAVRNGSSPKLTNLIIHSNNAMFGAGIACHAASPVMRDVLIAGNKGDTGGGIYCRKGASPLISNATLVANEAPKGAAIYVMEGSSPYIENSVLANHADGYGVLAGDMVSRVSLTCCNLWSNLPSDFGGGTTKTWILRDNLEDDPQFADAAKMDFRPQAGSPALSSESCGKMGTEHGRIPDLP
jgi:hypothetical protein